jgi:tetratricopeptide (TPR) repeat protein
MSGITSQNGSILSKRFVHLAVIALLGLTVYSNTFWVPFQFDDIPNISDNPLIRDFSYFLDPPEGGDSAVLKVFPSRYIGYLTFALNYHLHGLDVRGFHLLNILIHIINAFIVYALVLLSFQTPRLARTSMEFRPQYLAFIAALFFVLHPAQTQAVTYIVQRFASLATLFYLACMVLYIKARLSKGRRQWLLYTGALVSAVLAMKTKEIAATLPLAVMLYEFIFFEGPKGKRILRVLPIALTVLLIPLSFINTDTQNVIQTGMSRTAYLFTQFRVIAAYIRLVFLPMNQTLEYGMPVYRSFGNPAVVLSFILIVTLLSAGVFMLRRTANLRIGAFGVFFFLIALLAESSIFPIKDIIFEHRMYLPMAGASIAVATGLVVLLSRQRKAAAIAVVVILALGLAVTTYARNTVWQSSITLWTDVVSKAPGNARALNNLASEYIETGRIADAKPLLGKAIRLKPDYAEAYDNLGLLYQKRGMYTKAIKQHQKALSIRPDFPEALNHMGVSLDRTGRYGEALAYYQCAIEARPFYSEAYENLGVSLGMQGRLAESLEALQKAVSLDPGSPTAYSNMGNVHYQLGDFQKAERHYLKALDLNEAYVDARINLIRVYAAQSRIEKAHTEINRLSRYAPDKAESLRQSIQSIKGK